MTRTLCASILVLFLAAACDRGEAPPTKTPPPQAAATPPAPPPPAPQAATEPKPEAPARTTGPFDVVGIDLGTAVGPDGRVTTPADHLPATNTIHAVLRTEGKPQAMTLSARWSYNRQQNLGTQEIVVAADQNPPPAATLTKDGGFQ